MSVSVFAVLQAIVVLPMSWLMNTYKVCTWFVHSRARGDHTSSLKWGR